MKRKKWLILIGILIGLLAISSLVVNQSLAASSNYKILAWNDLGMHCYSRDFADMAVLPPYNNLWVQVVKAGDPPELVTSGITVEYYYPDNTRSDNKTNFWNYDQALFGVDLPLNIGLKGKGLSGTMDLSGDHFIAEGIPITEYSDSNPTVRQPYQLATVVVKDSTTKQVLTSIQVVTPTSSEMRCDNCHTDTGIAKPSHPTGKVETNILQLHDENTGTSLMASRPVLCASCHASNALGAAGKPGINNLSKSMHQQHASVVPSTLDGCYNCHPGPQTRCLRDVMSQEEGMTCVSCHGGLGNVSTNPNPWLHEPRCDSCHNSGYFNQNQALYRFSQGHGGLYCETCHDSTHAIAPSREANDAIKFNQLQGRNGPIEQCSVCHTQTPSSGGPHAVIVPRVTSVTRSDSNPTNASTISFKVSFSKSVTGVDSLDFALTTTGVIDTTITNVTGSGSAYSVTVNTGSGNGTIRLDIVDNDSIRDAANNPLGGVGLGNGNFSSGEIYNIVRSVNIDVVIGSNPMGSYTVLKSDSLRMSYVGIDSGPVQVISNWAPIVASLRDLWSDGTNPSSSTQLMGLPASQLSSTYVFPAYNNVSLDDQLRFGNVGTAPTTVTVTIGGVYKGSYSLNPNQSMRVNYPGVDSGPVVVQSSNHVPIIATIRDSWWDGSTWSSYAQLMGLPGSQLSSTYVFPAYNNVSLDEQLRFGNVGTTKATVTVTIGGVVRGSYVLAPNQSMRVSYAGVDSGPVVVQSSGNVPIIASIRDSWWDGSKWSSYSQLMGLPGSLLSNTYVFPVYDNVNVDAQLRFGNVGSAATDVTVTIAGVYKGTYHLTPGQSQRVYYSGVNAGPVVVQSSGNVPIIASIRDSLWDGSVWSSYSQIMGLPGSQLSTAYFFPAYNNVSYNNELRIAVP